MIGRSIEVFGEPPKQIDVLRLYFNQPQNLPENKKIIAIVKQIEKSYRDGGLDVKGIERIRLKTKRLVKTCKDFVAKRKICRNSKSERRRQENFRAKIHNVFEVAHASQNDPVTSKILIFFSS